MYDLIFRHLIFPFSEWKRGRNWAKPYRYYQKMLNESADQLEAASSRRLNNIVVHAATTSEFWRKRFVEAEIDPSTVWSARDLRHLPVLEKHDVQRHREEMRSRAIPVDRMRLDRTGGSTAAPMEFYRDLGCLTERAACDWILYDRIGRTPYDRWGQVWGAMQDLGRPDEFKTRLRNLLLRRAIILPGNRLEPQSMDRFLKQAGRFRIRFLHGYSQAICLLAHHAENTTNLLPHLKAITVTAEPISSDQKKMVEQVFKCPVYVLYGTREFGIAAGEAPGLTGMHINPLSTLIEFLGPNGTPTEPGTPGQIIVTDLLNRAQPMIRYRIGDVGIPMEPNGPGGCGLPRMEIQAGRETDLVITPDGNFVCGAALTLITANGISKLQYIQTQKDSVTIRYVKNDSYCLETLAELRRQILGVLGPKVQLEFCETDDIPTLSSGKYQYVHSEVARRHFRTSGD